MPRGYYRDKRGTVHPIEGRGSRLRVHQARMPKAVSGQDLPKGEYAKPAIGFYTKEYTAPSGEKVEIVHPITSPNPPTETLTQTEAGKAYVEKQAEKAERYRELAVKAKVESTETHARAEQMADVIPFGQPILVGHHSEQADRNFRERIDKTYQKSFELDKKADYYEKKAENAENPYAIRSDDPDATIKLKQKIGILEKEKEDLNAKSNEQVWKEHGSVESLKTWDLKKMERESLNRRISDSKKRIDEVQKTQAIPARSETINGTRLVVDKEDNRVKLFFPSIPSQETRSKLKSNGFHFSPQTKAWQRQTSNQSIYLAEEIAKESKTTE